MAKLVFRVNLFSKFILFYMKKHLKKGVFLLFALWSFTISNAQTADTIIVAPFSFGSPQEGWFMFPSDTVRFEKILMEYTLKCNPNQNPPCGEWDYLTYTYLFDHTGFLDSSKVNQPTFLVNNQEQATVSFMHQPTFRYIPLWQHFVTHSDTTSLLMGAIGSGAINVQHPFGTKNTTARSQYLWFSSELISAGIMSGNLTGIQFNILTLGSSMRNLSIRIKATTLDSLSADSLSSTGFTEVYSKNTQFSNLGWNQISFTNPYFWNGTSNIIIEITFDNIQTCIDHVVAASVTPAITSLYNSSDDRMLSTNPNGYVNIPINSTIAAIDTAISISLWAFGSSHQPVDGSCFEAIDSLGNRLLNSHLPWSDSHVYWDAGYSGSSFDRIDKIATTNQIKEQWNHWVFTKNSNTGLMKIYLNGSLWHSGSAKIKSMGGIKTFLIGKGTWSGAKSYDGFMDEFAVFNTVLDTIAIKKIATNGISSIPDYTSNLAVYYSFNDESSFFVTDSSSIAQHSPAMMAAATNPLKPASQLFKSGVETSRIRPNIILEQGVFTSHIDSILVIDSIVNTPVVIVEFSDSIMHPGQVTDTIIGWPMAYGNFQYDSMGLAIDSTFVPADETKTLFHYTWYRLFPQVNRYELARYITPYGNNLSLGDGWKWTFDVSDYRTLLADSVHLTAGNWQELLDLKFIMIKGTPPRDVTGITNVYTGSFNYGLTSDPIENHLPALKFKIPNNSFNARWKSRVTGHGMDSPENCAEFCAKTHYYKVNDTLQFTKLIWRDNCDLSPLYPQGGTWVYDRANWCPGAEVETYDLEISDHISSGDSVTLNHDVQSYTSNGPWDYFQIEDQLVTYKAPNFTLDAALENIISPSANKMFLRQNPICSHPKVIIKNTGITTLTSLKISYGIEGVTPSIYTWHGSLKFMEMETVELDTFTWAQGAHFFNVSISEPNDGLDQYSRNNSLRSEFVYPPLMPSQFVIEVKTNNYPSENEYSLVDAFGNEIISRTGLFANTFYRDTLTLADGCYSFLLTDSGEDGLSFWANTAQGSGLARFKRANSPTILKNFNADFGGQIYQQFTVGISSNIEDYTYSDQTNIAVFPNPATDNLYVNIDLSERSDGVVSITNDLGQTVYQQGVKNIIAESLVVDVANYPQGMYFVVFTTKKEVVVRKFMKLN